MHLCTAAREERFRTAKETIMFAAGDYQIVITYRNTNYLWKDRAVDRSDMADTAISPTEHTMHCFVPHFWDRRSRPSRIERVTVTQQDHAFRLPWQLALDQATPSALSLDISLRYDAHAMLTSVAWA
jgi:hypothetical protein